MARDRDEPTHARAGHDGTCAVTLAGPAAASPCGLPLNAPAAISVTEHIHDLRRADGNMRVSRQPAVPVRQGRSTGARENLFRMKSHMRERARQARVRPYRPRWRHRRCGAMPHGQGANRRRDTVT